MTDRAGSSASLTRRAVERWQEGDTADARQVLAEALALDPGYEPAWLWFAHITQDPGERRFALEQAAAANPESRAKQELAVLRRTPAVEPPEVADLVAPIPPMSSAGRSVIRHRVAGMPRPSSRLWVVAAVGLVLALVLGAAVLAQRRESLYIAVVDDGANEAASGDSEIVRSLQLFFDRLNAEGGIDGRQVTVLRFHDADDPVKAQAIARQIVNDDRVLLVIGHRTSTTSLAAAPIYAAAGLPAITSTATAAALTAGDPWYFRTVFDSQTEGMLISAYARHILDASHISVLSGTGDFGRSLATGVVQSFSKEGAIRHNLGVEETGGDRQLLTISDAVRTLSADDNPGPIVLALQGDSALQAVVALRKAGVNAPIIGGDTIVTDAFLQQVRDAIPGDWASGIMAAAPLFLDALSSDVLRWRVAYVQSFGEEPTWRGATTYDAAIAATAALRAAGVTGAGSDVSGERGRIRDALLALDSPEHALAGLLGPIYFDANRTTPRVAVFGAASEQGYVSAPEQLQPYSPSGVTTQAEDLASGNAIEVAGQILGKQRVVHVGVNINELSDLDTVNPSFSADFFLWFTYVGDDSATDVSFINAVDPTLVLGDPERSTDLNGVKYKLYRLTARFKAPLEFHDFPFDKQHLLINLENRTLPSSRLVYAVDPHLVDETQAERLQSGTNAAASIDAIPNWIATSLYYYQQTLGSTAFLGDPELNLAENGLEYSVLTTDITVERNLAAFLVKNLLPLGLLAAITYVSLFFSFKQTAERVSLGISGILTAAVLLTNVTGALPQVGYTVAIEWGFYAFIFLSATCIVIGLAGDRLYEERRISDLHRLDVFSRIYYPVFILVIVVIYALHYAT